MQMLELRLPERLLLSMFCTILILGPVLSPAAVPQDARGFLIVNAMIIDGTGAPGHKGALRVRGDRIAAVGNLSPDPGEQVLDAGGRVLAPGFIDTHSHAIDYYSIGGEQRYLPGHPEALMAVSQGVTTLVVGQDGRSFLPLGPGLDSLERLRVAVNVASLVGHGAVRLKVLGDDFRREATPAEILAMRREVARAMREGAFGLSSGLEYNPGVYSSRAEVQQLAAEAARFRGTYVSHIRSEDRNLWSALEEIIDIGKKTGMPVHISHMKLGMKDLWGQSARFLDVINAARHAGVNVSGDVYPYDFWETSLSVLFPQRNYHDPKAAQFALDHVVPAAGIRFVKYEPEPSYVGKSIAEIAVLKSMPEAETLLSLIVDSATPEHQEMEIMAGMSQPDVDALLGWSNANVCSDGALDDDHPRGAGTFTKVLRYYVREHHLLTLEEAVHKMTSRAAANLGIERRGLLKQGYFADLVLFDPATVSDRSTVEDPRALSSGIEGVWVNGVRVYLNGLTTGARAGVMLRHRSGAAWPALMRH